jgi:hypothetical protein
MALTGCLVVGMLKYYIKLLGKGKALVTGLSIMEVWESFTPNFGLWVTF